jgi:hypothetical protein
MRVASPHVEKASRNNKEECTSPHHIKFIKKATSRKKNRKKRESQDNPLQNPHQKDDKINFTIIS